MPDPEVVRAINEANRSLNKSLEGLKVDVSQSKNLLTKILDYFSQLQKTIESGVNRIIQNQSIIMIISKTSELESFRDLLSEQQRVLEQKKSYLIDDLKKLSDRYLQLNEELSQNAENTIQKLDGHVIKLTDDFYMATVEKAHDQLAAPMSLSSERYFLDCSTSRKNFIEGAVRKASDSINDFLEVRARFIEDIEKYFDPDDLAGEAQSTVVPFFVLKEKGQEDIVVKGPGRISYQGTGGEISTDPGVEDVEAYLNTNDRAIQMSEKLTYRPLSSPEKEGWLKMLESLFENELLNDRENTGLMQALQECIREAEIEVGERIDD